MGVVRVFDILLRAFLLPRATLAAEILALRHQLGVLQRSVRRPRLRQRDRILWVWLSQLWADWRSSLIIVKPKTIVRWHRGGFRLFYEGSNGVKRPRGESHSSIRARAVALPMLVVRECDG